MSVVEERSDSQLGRANAASEGIVGPKQLERRPILRPGELLETVPGVIITQHSGSGKANQYFLRGFNLDHGTDLAVSLDGMPLNMPTHGHGQGYIDLNLLIPELVSGLRYRKGSYEADQGDFSSAGSVDISYARRLGRDAGVPATQSVDIGNFGRRRFLLTGNAGEKLIYGLETTHYDGPWDLPEDFRKLNAVLRYATGTETRGLTVTGMAYDGKWNSTDQVPRRAIESGLINRFGNLDPTDGGKSSRYSLSAQLRRDDTTVSAYAIDYRLNLFSNFTYFLDDPVRGDQFEQADRRRVYGFQARRDFKSDWGERKMTNSLGFQARRDDIGNVGLYRTQGRDR
ncbi:MAG: TonB-dependent receptor, partial [Hyphomicrobiales bacterium]